MITFPLQSGSNGNCIYVEADGVRLLFDAGISGKQAELRLANRGHDIREVDAVILSHDHSDHSRSAGIFCRKFGLPLLVTRRTLAACAAGLGRVDAVRHFTAGSTLTFGPVAVHTIRTPHDAAEGVAFIVEAGGRRLGIFTDLGHPFPGLADALASVHAAYLESNYDPRMLEEGWYPEFLKRRIRGDGGHLSNPEAGELVRSAVSAKSHRGGGHLNWVALSHLSENNNTPVLAADTFRRIVGKSFPCHVASRHEAGEPREV
jgi:phosphoribosyl 1,2-cyclic phosphodiesterase